MELFDVLEPPTFKKSGVVKSELQAIQSEDWLGTFNLWIVQNKPVPAIVYQQRSPQASWAPSKLDVSAGGYYRAGETVRHGLREVQEELGKKYVFAKLTSLGRKINVSPDQNNTVRNSVVDIFMVLDNTPLSTYMLDEAEVYSIFSLPLDELLKVHTRKGYTFSAQGLLQTGELEKIIVSKNSFPYNWDDYHFKIALLAQRFLKKEKNLLY